MAEIKRSNPKAFETLALNIKELDGIETKVGWFESAKYEDGTPVALAAAANELGHGKTPPRSFMRPTAIEQKKAWSNLMRDGAKAVIAGKATVRSVFEALGTKAEGDIVKTISEVYDPPLSPITIELRAMKKANPSLVVTARTVGIAAKKVKQPGYMAPSGVSTKPLNDTGLMIATLTSITDKA